MFGSYVFIKTCIHIRSKHRLEGKKQLPVIIKSLISRGHLGMEPLGLCMLLCQIGE